MTKIDGLITMAFNELRDKEKLGIKDAKNLKVERADDKLKNDFIDPLMQASSRPTDYVQLDGKPASTIVMRLYTFCLTFV